MKVNFKLKIRRGKNSKAVNERNKQIFSVILSHNNAANVRNFFLMFDKLQNFKNESAFSGAFKNEKILSKIWKIR